MIKTDLANLDEALHTALYFAKKVAGKRRRRPALPSIQPSGQSPGQDNGAVRVTIPAVPSQFA